MKAKDLELLIATGRATDVDMTQSGIAYRDVAAIKRESPFQVRGHAVKAAPEGGDSRTVRYVMSTEDVDRMGDIIRVYGGKIERVKDGAEKTRGKGWQLALHKANPVFLWSHESHNPAIGLMSGVRRDKIVGAGGALSPALVGAATFHPKEVNPFAETIFQLVKTGGMPGSSVGFLPIEVNEGDEEWRSAKGLGKWGVEFVEQELLEDSACCVPANPFALAENGGKTVAALGDLVKRGIVTREAADALREHYPITAEDLEQRLAEKVRSFVDLGMAPQRRQFLCEVDEEGKASCEECSVDGGGNASLSMNVSDGFVATGIVTEGFTPMHVFPPLPETPIHLNPRIITATLSTPDQVRADAAEAKLKAVSELAAATFDQLAEVEESLSRIQEILDEDDEERVAPTTALDQVTQSLAKLVTRLEALEKNTTLGGPTGAHAAPSGADPEAAQVAEADRTKTPEFTPEDVREFRRSLGLAPTQTE